MYSRKDHFVNDAANYFHRRQNASSLRWFSGPNANMAAGKNKTAQKKLQIMVQHTRNENLMKNVRMHNARKHPEKHVVTAPARTETPSCEIPSCIRMSRLLDGEAV